MIRCMMLALTLMLITLSAAFLGRDEQLRQVLRQTKLPIESSSSYSQSSSEPSEKAEETSRCEPTSAAPRFIPDEPLPETPKSAPANITPPDAVMSASSAKAELFPIETEEEKHTASAPSEQQKIIVAEPFVKELFDLTEKSSDDLRVIIDRAVGEFLSAPPTERNGGIPALIEKYTPEVLALEADSDSSAEAILLRMKEALSAIGADDGLVNDARASYQHAKQQQINRYTELFSIFAPSVSE